MFHHLSRSECSIWLALLMTESVAIVTFNIVTIIVFTRNRSLRKRGMSLIINLAVADMLTGGVSELTNFILVGSECNLWKGVVTRKWYDVILSLEPLFPISSLTAIVAISLKQLHATFRPFRHRVIKKWVYGRAIAVVWVVAALVISVRHIMRANVYYFWMPFNSICLFIISVSYTSIAMKFNCGRNHHIHGAANRERKLTVTLFIMTFLSLMVWSPFVVFRFLYLTPDRFPSPSTSAVFRLNYALAILFYANSLINPILYAIRIPEFKRAVVSLFRCQANPVAVNIPLRVFPPR